MRKIIAQTMDEERSLYHLTDAEVSLCNFEGPADGESALKEGRNLKVSRCRFVLRYPMWHDIGLHLSESHLYETARAPLWYDADVAIDHCRIESVKALRECQNVSMSNCTVVSPELFWRCGQVTIRESELTGEYMFMTTSGLTLKNVTMHGKYSFQYTKNVAVEDSLLDTKDAFWHAENVTVKNCTVKGEYLGWYSKNLTLINCRISGTQPFCYCENLKLINCTMEQTDLAFEYSSVEAEIIGHVDSVKNPRAGYVHADSIGETILSEQVYPCDCEILTKA